MERVEKLLREVENRLVYLSSHPEMKDQDRSRLLPVLSSHLETVNRWKLMKLTGDPA